MSRFKLLYFVIFIINLHKLYAQISDKRLCVDKECSVPISYAKTLLRYSSPDSRILSFAPNVDITIYSKSAGSREDLWGGEINGKRGYIPKHMVRETKVLQKPSILVDTEFSNDTDVKQVPSQVEPDKVQEPYEVVDGTTIYLNSQDNINPSSTESPIQTTALPLETNKISSSQITESPIQVPPAEKVIEQTETPQVQENDEATSNQVVNNETETTGDNAEEEVINIDDDDDDDTIVETVSEEPNSEVKAEFLPTPVPAVESNVTSQTVITEEPKEPTKLEENIKETKPEEDKSKNEPQIPTTQESHVEIKSEPETTKTEEIKQIPENINEDTDSNQSESVKEEPKTVVTETLDTVLLPTDKKVQTNEEAAIISPLEPTTLSPEIEVPQPFDDSFIQVTENPAEVVTEAPKINPEVIPSSLPPLGLFAESKQEPETENSAQQKDNINVESSNVESEASQEENVNADNNDVQSETSQEENTNADNSNAQSEASQVENVNVDNNDVQSETSQGENANAGNSHTQSEASQEENVNVGSSNVESEACQEENVNLDSIDVKTEAVEEETNNLEVTDYTQQVEDSVKSESEFENPVPVASSPADDESITLKEETSDYEQDEESSNFGFFNNILSFFWLSSEQDTEKELTPGHISSKDHFNGDELLSNTREPFCDATSCTNSEPKETVMDFLNFNSDVFLYLVTTAISVIIFLFGYIAFDKSKREGPLVAKINKLEKELLVILKENQILQEKIVTDSGYETNDKISNEVVENLKQDLIEVTEKKNALEEQVQSLEKELENSTEVGMELNRMLTEILSSEGGSDILKANVENLQRQLVEQQATINSVNETLAITNTENHELRLELELSNKKVVDLQAELDKLLINILKIEEEKESQQGILETEIANLRQKYDEINNKFKLKENEYTIELKQLNNRLEQAERKLELKMKEYNVLTESIKQIKAFKNDSGAVKNILEVGEIKAELQLLKSENERLTEKIQQEQEMKNNFEKRSQLALDELQQLKEKYDEADKLKVETQTKLEVLSNYFKDREAQWQKEISKHEALWAEKEGEATSTTERIKFMQEQLQNYKAQTESLKQEIMSQEIELKSQISVLEKKVHENWVSTRQAERKLEDAKQEAAQLRHRLTLRERAIQEDKNQHRLQSPIEQNGEMPDSPASPPLLYGTRDHITKSPPLPGLPPFLPPPPGVPFMPPPIHGVPPFIPPPPPNMFPGDHRPPPLGRMSSPPLNSRYSPSSRGYSPYDRNSSSPSDSEYGTSPPHRRGYSPFNSRDDRRDYKRPPPVRSNGRNLMQGGSSGSGHSNESLEKINRQQSKV